MSSKKQIHISCLSDFFTLTPHKYLNVAFKRKQEGHQCSNSLLLVLPRLTQKNHFHVPITRLTLNKSSCFSACICGFLSCNMDPRTLVCFLACVTQPFEANIVRDEEKKINAMRHQMQTQKSLVGDNLPVGGAVEIRVLKLLLLPVTAAR